MKGLPLLKVYNCNFEGSPTGNLQEGIYKRESRVCMRRKMKWRKTSHEEKFVMW
jgi:hypothetical protein